MLHKEKVKLARKLRTKLELLAGVPLFLTNAWEKRKEAIKKREHARRK